MNRCIFFGHFLASAYFAFKNKVLNGEIPSITQLFIDRIIYALEDRFSSAIGKMPQVFWV